MPSENIGFAGAPTRTIDNKSKIKGGLGHDQYSPQKKYPGATDDKPSVKMHAPPGGKSNFSIGQQFTDDDYHKPAFRQQDMNKPRGKYAND